MGQSETERGSSIVTKVLRDSDASLEEYEEVRLYMNECITVIRTVEASNTHEKTTDEDKRHHHDILVEETTNK